ncbi:hypothetical protein BKA82DRAFT_4016176 [Pisolithus tinctorius]|nr:hypothetical protein BKA82DRAFT_4016176 [Pisolithus tinctorius]
MNPSSGDLAIGVGCEVHIAQELNKVILLPAPEELDAHQTEADVHIQLRSAHFLKGKNQVVVAYLNHRVICWDIQKSQSLWQICPAHMHQHIGSAALSPDKTHILISNLTTGLDLYPVVSGATDGKVWVWCMRMGTQVQTLRHRSVMVQVLCSFQGRNYNFLATSAAGHSTCTTIKLWKAKTDTEIEHAFGQLFNLDEAGEVE